HAVDARVNELEELLPLLMKDKLLAKGVSHLLSSQLTRILRTHAAMSVLGHGLLRGAGLGGHAVDARVNELEELLPLLMKDKLLAKGVSHLLS
ncbi:hypothetical protein BMR86_25755, partial [Stenotrophomonas sp. KAs 5-3]